MQPGRTSTATGRSTEERKSTRMRLFKYKVGVKDGAYMVYKQGVHRKSFHCLKEAKEWIKHDKERNRIKIIHRE